MRGKFADSRRLICRRPEPRSFVKSKNAGIVEGDPNCSDRVTGDPSVERIVSKKSSRKDKELK